MNPTTAFHLQFYNEGDRGGTWKRMRWRGAPIQKFPTDLLVYQEIIHELRPRVIVETGTYHGGSALFLADMLALCGGDGHVVTVDLTQMEREPHPRITYICGSSIDPNVIAQVREATTGLSPVLVVLDSDHRADHVTAEMEAYWQMVTVGSYLIVEDTNLNGYPVWSGHGPGPREAVEQFLQHNKNFIPDRSREYLMLTANEGGYLRRVA